MRNVHGVSTSALLSMLRAEGKILTSQQIMNALSKYNNAKSPNASDSASLLQSMCDDCETVFVVRFNVIDNKSGQTRGVVNFLRIPGHTRCFCISRGQLYQECGNVTHLEPVARRPCVLDMYYIHEQIAVYMSLYSSDQRCVNLLRTSYVLFMYHFPLCALK